MELLFGRVRASLLWALSHKFAYRTKNASRRRKKRNTAPLHSVWRIAELASAPDSIIWPTDISAYFGGRGVAADKARRIRSAAAKLIDLYDSVLVKPNWRSPENVRTALAKLEQIRGAAATRKTARIMSRSRLHRGDFAASEAAASDGGNAVNAARATLAGEDAQR